MQAYLMRKICLQASIETSSLGLNKKNKLPHLLSAIACADRELFVRSAEASERHIYFYGRCSCLT